MQKIKPCHHCRADDCKTATDGVMIHVYCNCGARGPRSETQVGAIALWNVRCRGNDEKEVGWQNEH